MGEEKSNVVITEEGALSVKKLTFWEAAMIIVGANIGAGILGLAYSSRKAGWPILLMWLRLPSARKSPCSCRGWQNDMWENWGRYWSLFLCAPTPLVA